MYPKTVPITSQTALEKQGFGRDPGGSRGQRALLGLQLDLGYSLWAVRDRTALLTGEVVSPADAKYICMADTSQRAFAPGPQGPGPGSLEKQLDLENLAEGVVQLG